MTTTATTGTSSNPASFADLGLSLKTPAMTKAGLGQDDFLKLMTTQLKNQDPTKPMDSNEFLGQIAQFSTVSGIQGLQKSFDSLSASLTSSQSLQAAGLVGHGVLFPSTQGVLAAGGTLNGGVEVPAGGELQVQISDAAGQVVRRIDCGTQSAGTAYFSWDGKDGSGNALAAGSYKIGATLTQNGVTQSATTLAAGLVQSVSLGNAGLTLNLAGYGSQPFSAVRQII